MTGCRNNQEVPSDLPYYRTADLTPEWFDASSDDVARLHQIEDFSFVNQHGQTVTSRDFEDKI